MDSNLIRCFTIGLALAMGLSYVSIYAQDRQPGFANASQTA